MKVVPGWYLIYTKPKHERKVAHQLKEKNVSYFLPETKVLRKWSDRNKIIDVPLFPSYIFVSIDKLEDYYIGLECEGVLYYVRFGKEMAKVQENVINGLKLVTNDGENVEVTSETFQAGQKYIIQHGVFSGLPCEVVDYKSKKKILVRIQLLNRSVLADISSSLIN